MTFEELMKTTETLTNPYVDEWKKQGKKIMGYYCTYTPEEILLAGDVMAFRMRGTEAEGTSLADTIMTRFNCSFIRATLDLIMSGKYDFLDGLVCLNSCDHARRIFDIFNYKILGQIDGFPKDYPLFFLSIPHLVTERGEQWLKDEFEIFKTNLEKAINVKITNDGLNDSIKLLNENRRLLKEIHKLRVIEKPKLNGADMLKINIANAAVPKNIANQELKSYIDQLKNKDGISDYRARILLIGSVIDDPGFLNIIEGVGGLVVSDMLCYGTRNFWDLTDEGTSDPMGAIAKRYNEKISCPRMMNRHENRSKFLNDLIKEAKVDGVIATRIEFCDLHGCDNMIFEHELEEANIPILSLDRDYFLGDTGRFKTRCEAFIEQIE